jgi:hypothetical protein
MIEGARRSDEAMLLDMIRTERGPFAHGVIASPLSLMVEKLQMSTAIRLYDQGLITALRECGWRDMGLIANPDLKLSSRRVWAAPHLLDVPTPELRRMLAEIEGEKTADDFPGARRQHIPLPPGVRD